MYLLYLDESGNENDAGDQYFVLAGVALFERQTYFLTQELDRLQEKHFPRKQPIPFHASEIRAGRGLWRSVPQSTRSQVLTELCTVIEKAPDRGRHLFGVAVEKSNQLYGEKAVEKATEEICRRFDICLQRKYHESQDPQRGLIIFSEGRFDARAKVWVRDFHRRGTKWGAINNLADIPYFAPMKESRLLQVADLLAHAVWLMYEKKDVRLIRNLLPCFDTKDGTTHGLVHIGHSAVNECTCPACYSRRQPGYFGPWFS